MSCHASYENKSIICSTVHKTLKEERENTYDLDENTRRRHPMKPFQNPLPVLLRNLGAVLAFCAARFPTVPLRASTHENVPIFFFSVTMVETVLTNIVKNRLFCTFSFSWANSLGVSLPVPLPFWPSVASIYMGACRHRSSALDGC